MKKLIITDPVWICGSDLIGSDIRNFGWEARMYGIWQPETMLWIQSNLLVALRREWIVVMDCPGFHVWRAWGCWHVMKVQVVEVVWSEWICSQYMPVKLSESTSMCQVWLWILGGPPSASLQVMQLGRVTILFNLERWMFDLQIWSSSLSESSAGCSWILASLLSNRIMWASTVLTLSQ
jgi:hypothetical protein